jgi:hypothetical protein
MMAGQQQNESADGAGVVMPLAHPLGTRDGTLSKDAKLVNCLVERSEAGMEVLKRPGMSSYAAHSAAPAQGLFTLDLAGYGAGEEGYGIWNDTCYKLSTMIGLALPSVGTADLPCETLPHAATATTLIKNSERLWSFSGGTLARITASSYPTYTVPGIAELDGTFYVMDALDGTIRGSGVQDWTSWDALNFIGPNKSLGKGVALVRHLNYLVGLYDQGTQLFYDAANATGSPLLPVDNASWLTGCASGRSVARVEDLTVFVGKGAGKGRSVQLLSGLQLTQISDPYVERVLNRDSLVGVTALGLRVAGHSLYILNLPASGVSLCYDLTYQMWTVWQSANAAFRCTAYLNANGLDLLQDASNGKVYSIDPGVYQDDGGSLPVTIITPPKSWGTLKRKFMPALYLLGDTQSTLVSVSYTDDDYQSFSTPRTIDLATQRKMLQRCGSSRKRAWKLTHDDNTPLRLTALELEVEAGAGG